MTKKLIVLSHPQSLTDEVGARLERILHEKKELAEALMGRATERKLEILKELLIDAYVAGFFNGTKHLHKRITH